MDRDPDELDGRAEFSFSRLWLTLAIATAIILIGSFLVRTFPNNRHQGGYDAVMEKDSKWVQSEVEGAHGTALGACDALHRQSEASEGSPRYDYDSFVQGCSEAIDQVLGRHVPLLTHSN